MRTTTKNPIAGFTLVEVAIILLVIAILSAIVTPVLSSTIADARLSAAKSEMSTIVRAFRELLADLGCPFVPRRSTTGNVYRDRAKGVAADIPPVAPPMGGDFDLRPTAPLGCEASAVCGGEPVAILVTSGDIPSVGPEGDWSWADPVDRDEVDFLEYYLVSNTPGGKEELAFPTAAECGSREFGGAHNWRGAYTTPGTGDPWGNRYMINSLFLPGFGTDDVVILSAGPDQEIDTEFAEDGLVAGDDDLVLLIAPGR